MANEKIINGRSTELFVRALVARFLQMQPGDIISHGEIARIGGCEYPSDRYNTVFQRSRKVFQAQTGIYMLPLNGIGYRLPEGPTQMKAGVKKTRNTVRGIKRACTIVAGIADERLTNDERKARDYVVERVRLLHLYANEESKKAKITVNKPATLPVK